MGKVVICDECGCVNDLETARIKDRGGIIKMFRCSNCGYVFFKMDREIEKDGRRIRRESNSELGKSLKEVENLLSNWGEEDRKLKIIANLLVEIGRKSFKNV